MTCVYFWSINLWRLFGFDSLVVIFSSAKFFQTLWNCSCVILKVWTGFISKNKTKMDWICLNVEYGRVKLLFGIILKNNLNFAIDAWGIEKQFDILWLKYHNTLIVFHDSWLILQNQHEFFQFLLPHTLYGNFKEGCISGNCSDQSHLTIEWYKLLLYRLLKRRWILFI